MPYSELSQLPDHVRKLSRKKQIRWMATFNGVYQDAQGEKEQEGKAFRIANASVHEEDAVMQRIIAEILADLYFQLTEEGQLAVVAKSAVDPDPHGDAHTAQDVTQMIQKGAMSAAKDAHLAAKSDGKDHAGCRAAIVKAIADHIKQWDQFRTKHPVVKPEEKPAGNREHGQAIDALGKEVTQLKTAQALSSIRSKVELEKVRAEGRIQAIRLRADHKVASLRSGRTGK